MAKKNGYDMAIFNLCYKLMKCVIKILYSKYLLICTYAYMKESCFHLIFSVSVPVVEKDAGWYRSLHGEVWDIR